MLACFHFYSCKSFRYQSPKWERQSCPEGKLTLLHFRRRMQLCKSETPFRIPILSDSLAALFAGSALQRLVESV